MWWTNKHRRQRLKQGLMRSIFAVGVVPILIGCSGFNFFSSGVEKITPSKQTAKKQSSSMLVPFNDLLEANYIAADRLAVDFKRKKRISTNHMLAASFVNINNLNESSPLGRVISEQIASRLVQHRFKILEMKLRQNSIYIKEGKGEFLLSREIKEISASHDSDYVIVGTYAVAEKGVYVSARIVNTADNVIISAYNYQIALNLQTESLLNGTW